MEWYDGSGWCPKKHFSMHILSFNLCITISRFSFLGASCNLHLTSQNIQTKFSNLKFKVLNLKLKIYNESFCFLDNNVPNVIYRLSHQQ